jgi:hypothetical protein
MNWSGCRRDGCNRGLVSIVEEIDHRLKGALRHAIIAVFSAVRCNGRATGRIYQAGFCGTESAIP